MSGTTQIWGKITIPIGGVPTSVIPSSVNIPKRYVMIKNESVDPVELVVDTAETEGIKLSSNGVFEPLSAPLQEIYAINNSATPVILRFAHEE